MCTCVYQKSTYFVSLLDSRNQNLNQAVRLHGEHLYSLSHLTNLGKNNLKSNKEESRIQHYIYFLSLNVSFFSKWYKLENEEIMFSISREKQQLIYTQKTIDHIEDLRQNKDDISR